MTEISTPPARPADAVGKALFRIALGFVITGGVLMGGLVFMVVVSIAGRALFGAPVYGDFEMVAMGTAVSVTLFLPYCHLNRGNVIVDLFLARAPLKIKIGCDAAGALLLSGLAAVLAWRSTLGAADLFAYNEVTMILAIPIWWAFPFIVAALTLLAVCGMYSAACDVSRLFR